MLSLIIVTTYMYVDFGSTLLFIADCRHQAKAKQIFDLYRQSLQKETD